MAENTSAASTSANATMKSVTARKDTAKSAGIIALTISESHRAGSGITTQSLASASRITWKTEGGYVLRATGQAQKQNMFART